MYQNAPLKETLRQLEATNDLYFLPITTRLPKGERLIDRGRIHAVIAQLREEFDLILMDLPPLLAISEARDLAGIADGAIIATRWRKTPVDAINSARRLLPSILGNYIGVVMTRVDIRKQSSYARNDLSSYFVHYENYAQDQ